MSFPIPIPTSRSKMMRSAALSCRFALQPHACASASGVGGHMLGLHAYVFRGLHVHAGFSVLWNPRFFCIWSPPPARNNNNNNHHDSYQNPTPAHGTVERRFCLHSFASPPPPDYSHHHKTTENIPRQIFADNEDRLSPGPLPLTTFHPFHPADKNPVRLPARASRPQHLPC